MRIFRPLARARRLWAVLLSCAAVAPAGADARIERVDALFREWDRPDSPGCALGIVQNGRLVYGRGYGMANLEYAQPITTRTVFRTGSVSKQFAAMSAVLAARQGKLSLDEDVRKYLPELPAYEKPITIRHLLHHTSGLRDYLTLMLLEGKRDEDFYTEEEVLEALSRQKRLNFPPGSEYLYSNSGYFLLSQIIPRATGKSLRAFGAENIFEPLGMTDSHFHDDFRRIVPNRATGYRPREDGGWEIDMTTLNMVGDGGVFTTVEELVRWDRNFEQSRLGGPDVIREMVAPGVLDGGVVQDYALGLRVSSYRGLQTVGHAGSFVGFRAAMLRIPEERFSVMLLCNAASTEPSELAVGIADIYLADRLGPEEQPDGAGPDRTALAKHVGVYWCEETSSFSDVTLGEEGLELEEGANYRLFPAGENRFRAARGTTHADIDFDGEGVMRVQWSGQRPFTFERVERVAPAAEELREYAGTYRSDELTPAFHVEQRSGAGLTLRFGRRPPEKLEPVFRDGFRWERGSVVFIRDGGGRVTGFRLQAYRARNFLFERE